MIDLEENNAEQIDLLAEKLEKELSTKQQEMR